MTLIKLASGCSVVAASVVAAWRLSQAVLWSWCVAAAILLALVALCTVAWGVVIAARSGRREKVI